MGEYRLVNTRDPERSQLLGSDEEEEEDDDFFLNGPKVDLKVAGMQSQVQEVTDIIRDSVAKAVDRGQRLDDLQDRSERLTASSENFRSASTALRRKAWWENKKFMAVGSIAFGILLFIIIVSLG